MSGSYETNIHSTDINDQIHHGKFRSVVTVAKNDKFADFNCADAQYGGDDAACIQAALDTVTSGQVIQFSPGSYTITSNISKYNKNITIVGIGDVELVITTGLTTPAITFSGSYIWDYVLSADALINSRSITLSDASLVRAGDIILITNSDLWCPHEYPTQNTGESYLVNGVNGNDVTLNQPLLREYPTSKTSTAYVYRPIKVVIKNIKIVNQNNSGELQSLCLQYCKNSKISDSDVGICGTTSISLNTCYDVEIYSNYIHDSERSGYGYGIAISNASAGINIHNNRIERCRHCIACGTSTYIGLNRDIKVTDNTIISGTVDGSDAIDSHVQVLNYTITGNHIYLSNPALVACINNSEELIFNNNIIYGGSAVRRRGKRNGGNYEICNNIIEGGGIYKDSGMEGAKGFLKIIGNTAKNCINGIYITEEIFDRIDISSNTVDTSTGDAIHIIVPTATADNDLGEIYANKPTSICITTNYIKSPTYNGIYIVKNLGSFPANVTVSDNDISNANLTSGYEGIYFKDISNSIISKNKINGNYNGIGTHIKISSANETIYNNLIKDNVLQASNNSNPSYIIVDSCDTVTGWGTAQGSISSITVENGQLKIVGTTDAYGRLQIAKSFSSFGDIINFISYNINCTVSSNIRCTLKSSSTYINWEDDPRFKVVGNADTIFRFPTRLLTAGSTGMYPTHVSGAFNPDAITDIVLGISDATIPNTSLTFYVDSIIGDFGSFISTVGTNIKVSGNVGYVTENTGTATLLQNTTSIVVSHGLAAAPTNVTVTPKGNIGSCWVDTYTATTFVIHCSTAPASNVNVNWTAIV